MEIPQKAKKLAQFKNLLAYTVSNSLTVAPLAAGGLLATSLLSSNLPLELKVMGSSIGIIATAFTTLLRTQSDSTSFLNTDFWKNKLEKPFSNFIKNDYEKMLLTVREFGVAKSKTKNDYAVFLDNFFTHTLSGLDLQEAVINFTQTSPFESMRLTRDFKLSEIKSTYQKLFQSFEADPLYNEAYREKSQIFFAQHSVSFGVGQVEALLQQKDNKKNFRTEIMEAFDKRALFLLAQPSYPGLNSKDYQDLKKFIGKQTDSENLAPIFDLLYEYPAKVNWQELHNIFFTHYTKQTLFYEQTLEKMKTLAESQEKKSVQSDIQKEVLSSKIQAHRQAPDAQELGVIASQASLKTPFCSLVQYDSKNFPKEWTGIKDTYSYLFENQANLPEHSFYNLNLMLQNCLPSLIAADISLAHTQQMYIEKTQNLLRENLFMVQQQLTDLRQTLDEKVLQTLEVAKHYQHMKLGK